jgi:uncharacterized damage-inducible protein DinB
MTVTNMLISEAEATYAVAERLFRRVSDADLAWRPSQGTHWMTVGQLLMHCAAYGCGRAIQGFVTGNWGVGPQNQGPEVHIPPEAALPSVRSVAEALALLAADRHLALTSIAAAGEDALLSRRVAAPWGGPTLSLCQQLLHMIAHLAQHKGQLFYYLKLMGRDVRTEDLWGGAA